MEADNYFDSGDAGMSFREKIEFFADKNNDYSKEDLYYAFLAVTKLYLDELISARNFENMVVSSFGEQDAEEFFEQVATCSKTVEQGDLMTVLENDPTELISRQFDLLDTLKNDDPFED